MTPQGHFESLGVSHGARDQPWVERVDALLAAIETAGRPASPNAYRGAFEAVFAALDGFDEHLGSQRFLLGGEEPSGADWWLYCILVRFDVVYYGLHKCNRRRVVDYESLWPYLRDLHQLGEQEALVDFELMKRQAYADETINPRGIVPRGGVPPLHLPHRRGGLSSAGVDEDQQTRRRQGEWVRKVSAHRGRVGSEVHPAQAGRYHLYVANNCPWCHRVTLARKLKRLDDIVSMDVLFYRRDPEQGWQFRPVEPGCTADSVHGFRFIRELYEKQGSKEKSVPVLYDKAAESIVNNESAEIIRILNEAFVDIAPASDDLYPVELRDEIDALNAWIYTDINNGAYKAGFARTQQAYEVAYERFFDGLDRLDQILAGRRFLTGSRFTEADLRLFPTIFRFDHIYFTRFRLNKRMVREYRYLFRWLRDVYRLDGVAEASNLDHARKGYFGRTGNNIVPLGPDLGFGPPPTDAELHMLEP